MNPILGVKNLTKKFGGFTAADDISFNLFEGEILGLLGPNGAGKTTIIQMLLGVMEPTAGVIQYFGKNFKKYREEILKQVNYSSTYISLPWLFTVAESLEFFARLYEVDDRKKKITKLVAEFEIENLYHKQYYMLSAGEKTRVLLAKAFLNYPKIILLDEPTASLDVEIAVKVREFLKKEKSQYNVSMLFTSHNMAEVEEMCDRVIILKSGKIIAEDKPENLAKKITACQVELVITDDAQKAESFLTAKKVPFEKDRFRFIVSLEEKNIADFLVLLTAEKIAYEEISINKPDLEDYFLKMIELKT
ncbi:ABC transporter ATP-binding protein [Candidatus Microgenomates bacterium]|nr:ABC transporter ATP-binding protein [Candidatus Microgenomates bacterium]